MIFLALLVRIVVSLPSHAGNSDGEDQDHDTRKKIFHDFLLEKINNKRINFGLSAYLSAKHIS
jgi:hypothetical protein